MLARKFVSLLTRPTEGGHRETLLINGRKWELEKLSVTNSMLCTNYMPSGRSMFCWHAMNPQAPAGKQTWRLNVQLNARMQTKLPWALLYRLPPMLCGVVVDEGKNHAFHAGRQVFMYRGDKLIDPEYADPLGDNRMCWCWSLPAKSPQEL